MLQVRVCLAAAAMALLVACSAGFLGASRSLLPRAAVATRGLQSTTVQMAAPLITPQDAYQVMESKGTPYLDVRSPGEFANGRPKGSVNIPVMFPGPMGMSPNDEFISQVEGAFPKDAPLIVGCQAGPRSTRATGMLEAAGYSTLYNVEGGYSAWAQDESLPVEV